MVFKVYGFQICEFVFAIIAIFHNCEFPHNSVFISYNSNIFSQNCETWTQRRESLSWLIVSKSQKESILSCDHRSELRLFFFFAITNCKCLFRGVFFRLYFMQLKIVSLSCNSELVYYDFKGFLDFFQTSVQFFHCSFTILAFFWENLRDLINLQSEDIVNVMRKNVWIAIEVQYCKKSL